MRGITYLIFLLPAVLIGQAASAQSIGRTQCMELLAPELLRLASFCIYEGEEYPPGATVLMPVVRGNALKHKGFAVYQCQAGAARRARVWFCDDPGGYELSVPGWRRLEAE